MRASSRENQRPDRERLIFAVCHKCKATSATTIYRWENDCPACPYPGMLRLALSVGADITDII